MRNVAETGTFKCVREVDISSDNHCAMTQLITAGFKGNLGCTTPAPALVIPLKRPTFSKVTFRTSQSS